MPNGRLLEEAGLVCDEAMLRKTETIKTKQGNALLKPLPASPKGRRRFTRASWDRYFRLEIAPRRGCLEDISTYQRGKWGIVSTYDTYCFRL